MPRIYTSASDPLDFCRKHFPAEHRAKEKWGNVGDGPDGRGNCFAYEAEHPDYESDQHFCFTCHKPLKDRDN